MSAAIVIENAARTNKQRIEVSLMRHNHYYFHTVRINGRAKIDGAVIGRDRALEIYQSNADTPPVYTSGLINFDPEQPCEFVWRVEFVEELPL